MKVSGAKRKALPQDLPARTKRDEQRDATRQALKAAARKLFLNGEYFTTNVQSIAVEAGVTRATYYLHFPTKQAILWELLREEIQRQRGMYLRLAALSEPSIADVRDWLSHFARATQRSRRMISFSQMAVGLHPELINVFSEARDELLDILSNAYPTLRRSETRGARVNPKRIEGHLLIMQIDEVCLNLALGVWPLDRQASIDFLAARVAAFLASLDQ
ncbi:TetR/AcrR family transcriptional regulator [Terricaulis silvestris]|uniref:Mycofactocin system transcriptional regulator n=1 Tax=Terricaulis silvestris TaxID=2686094 RepID=A0A6I6ML81_9CAUL|nr:TetR/AcrR family transcriptional regulator [Terricaulis silvestris]QGZ96135.1 mycofactocin system transcriptional regulator [Terricaulis silvestris]